MQVQSLLYFLIVGTSLFAQPAAIPAEMAVPFGNVPGKIALTPDHLIFVNEQSPGASFAVHPQDIHAVTVNQGVASIQLSSPLRTHDGTQSQLSFRLAGNDAVQLRSWWDAGRKTQTSAAPRADTSVAAGPVPASEEGYQARHKHTIGGCEGQLLITPDRLIYESVTDIDHSRRWELKDIKEIERKNPYAIKVKPFTGTDYDIELPGNGMDDDAYQRLVQRITSARARQ